MVAYFLYRLGHFLAVHLPLKAGYRVATFLSLLKYYFSPRDRKAVAGNLKMILAPSQQRYVQRYAKQVFINFGKYLIEFFRLPLLKKEDLGRFIRIEGLEHIDEALKKGKGVIVISGHIGNWELGGVFMSLMGYPMIAVALPHKHRSVNSFFNRQREILGVEVVASLGLAVKKIYEGLKDNKIVALVGDMDFANGGRKMEFLGLSKVIPRGPAVLNIRKGAPIVPAFVIRQKDDTHVIEFMPPLPDMANEEEIMAAYIKIIEDKIRQYPTQWLMFREFWNE